VQLNLLVLSYLAAAAVSGGVVVVAWRRGPMVGIRPFALLMLAVTGLATLFLRHTTLFGIVLLVHLAAVVVAFAVAPYTKFVHVVFRLLAIYKDNLDRGATALSVR